MGINTVATRVEHTEHEHSPQPPPLAVQDGGGHSDDVAMPTTTASDRHQQWADVASVVNLAVRGAFPASPVFSARDPAAFQAHWRAVFAWLHDCVVADAGIATQLADPPVRRFEIRILDEGGGGGGSSSSNSSSSSSAHDNNDDDNGDVGCPCRLLPRTAPPSIVLRNDSGVTKGDLVCGLSRYLYGSDQLPLVYKQQQQQQEEEWQEDPDIGCCQEQQKAAAAEQEDCSPMRQQRGPALPYEAGWMSSYDGIWVYCCPPDQFASRTRGETEAVAGGQNQSETDQASLLVRGQQQRVKTRLRL